MIFITLCQNVFNYFAYAYSMPVVLFLYFSTTLSTSQNRHMLMWSCCRRKRLCYSITFLSLKEFIHSSSKLMICCHLLEREKSLPFHWSLAKCPQQPGLGYAKATSPVRYIGVPHEPPLLPTRKFLSTLDWRQRSQDSCPPSEVGRECPKQRCSSLCHNALPKRCVMNPSCVYDPVQI